MGHVGSGRLWHLVGVQEILHTVVLVSPGQGDGVSLVMGVVTGGARAELIDFMIVFDNLDTFRPGLLKLDKGGVFRQFGLWVADTDDWSCAADGRDFLGWLSTASLSSGSLVNR